MNNTKFSDPSMVLKCINSENSAGPIGLYKNGHLFHFDDDNDNILVKGKSGSGKTESVIIPFIYNCLNSKESVVILDYDGEKYKATSGKAAISHKVKVIDFSSPRYSPDTWNPLKEAYYLFNSGDPKNNDASVEIIRNINESIFPFENKEPFWENCARSLFLSMCLVLFEYGEINEINVESIFQMINSLKNKVEIPIDKSTKFVFDIDTEDVCKIICKYIVGENANEIKANLSTYSSAPRDTAGSIFATTNQGLNKFSLNPGLTEFLSNDSLNINELCDEPIAIYVILPSYTDSYTSLASVLLSQLVKHYIRTAQSNKNGKLNNRLNVIIDDLQALGNSIEDLSNFCCSKKYGIRFLLSINSESNLSSMFDKKADTIRETIGTTYNFASNNLSDMENISNSIGNREVSGNHNKIEPIISKEQLSAMHTGTCFINHQGREKYITHFFKANKMIQCSVEYSAPLSIRNKRNIFDIVLFAKTLANSVKRRT